MTSTASEPATAPETTGGQQSGLINIDTGQPAVQLVKSEEPVERFGGDALRDSMVKAHDESVARQDREAPAHMPTTYKQGEDSVDRMKAWFDLAPGEREEISNVSADIEQRRKDAAMFGLSLQEREAILNAERAKATAAPADYEPIKEAVKSAYADLEPQHVVQRWSEIDKFARKDPPGALRWLAGELGVDLRTLSAEPMQHEQQASPHVVSAITQFLNEHKDAKGIIADISDAIQNGVIQRSGNPLADLKSAYQHVKSKSADRRPRSRKSAAAWEDTMRRVGERIA